MSRAWGMAASALGQGILQMGQMNQRERMEAERKNNLERLRKENRDLAIADRNENREYQTGLLKTANDRQDKIALDKQKNANEQSRLDRESLEKRSNSNGSDKTSEFAMKNYTAISSRMASLSNQINKIKANEDQLSVDEVKKKVFDATALFDALASQRNDIFEKNPVLRGAIGRAGRPKFLNQAEADLIADVANEKPLDFGNEKAIALPDSQKGDVVDSDPRPVLSVGNKETASNDLKKYKSELSDWNKRNPDAKDKRIKERNEKRTANAKKREQEKASDLLEKRSKQGVVAKEIKSLFDSGKLKKMDFNARAQLVIKMGDGMRSLLPKEIISLLLKY